MSPIQPLLLPTPLWYDNFTLYGLYNTINTGINATTLIIYRLKKGKELRKADDIREVEKYIHLIKAPGGKFL